MWERFFQQRANIVITRSCMRWYVRKNFLIWAKTAETPIWLARKKIFRYVYQYALMLNGTILKLKGIMICLSRYSTVSLSEFCWEMRLNDTNRKDNTFLAHQIVISVVFTNTVHKPARGKDKKRTLQQSHVSRTLVARRSVTSSYF